MYLRLLRRGMARRQRWLRGVLFDSSPPVAAALTCGMFAATAALNCISPPYITFGTFYLVIIAYASWVLGRRTGWIVAAAAIILSIALNGFGAYVAMAAGRSRQMAIAWSVAMRILSSGAIIELVRSFRNSFDHERRLGGTDALTGLPNRRAFRLAAAAKAERIHRRGRTGVLAYADLDGFKTINDRLGHAAGDEVLVQFARMLAAAIRESDCLGRNGGDEFVLFLDSPDAGAARQAALRLQRTLNERLAALGHAGLSCSVGAVIVPPDTPLPEIDSLVAQADQLMYEAKRGKFMQVANAQADHASGAKLRA